jgi:phosphatidylserine/phosphatidylglycerophosphate/cardiolipin synthase-like enzyme
MGFEARAAILEVLDQAIADTNAQVRVIAYDLNEPEVVSRPQLQGRLKVIIDDSKSHGYATSAETQAAARLSASAGAANVKRQRMLNLQHNKTIVVDGLTVQMVACGSTNFSWRGFFVQNNNAMILHGAGPVAAFAAAFDNYWSQPATAFGGSGSAAWQGLGLAGIDAQVAFSPHAQSNALLGSIADDIGTSSTSSLF